MKRGSNASSDVFSPGMRRLVLLIVVLSGGAGVGALLYGASLVAPRGSESDSSGAGPLGHRVFAEVLEELGIHVLQSRGDRFDAIDAPLFFIEPTEESRVDGTVHSLQTALDARQLAGRPTVVVLPKWEFQLGIALGEPPVRLVSEERLGKTFDAALPLAPDAAGGADVG